MAQLLGEVGELLLVTGRYVGICEVTCHLEQHTALYGWLHGWEIKGVGNELEDALVADVSNLLGKFSLGTGYIVPVAFLAVAVIDCFL